MTEQLRLLSSVSEVCDFLGRRAIAARVGRGLTAVSNAASEGVFPAAWFVVVSEMCAKRGAGCPRELFSFVQPTEEADPEIAQGGTPAADPDAEDIDRGAAA